MRPRIPSTRLIEFLLRVRPAQVASLLKTALGIRRTTVPTDFGCTYNVDPVSTFGLDLIRARVYEPPMTELLQTILGASDVFVDVGANEGYFSCLAAKICSSGMVYAIEPQSRLQPVLADNVRLNSLENVRIEHLAITSARGNVALYLRPSTNMGASSMFRYWKLGWITEEVAGDTLDSYVTSRGLDRVRLMKVDCEGAETHVFAGAGETLLRGTIDCIALEYHPQIIGAAACRAIHAKLTSAKYAFQTWKGLTIYSLAGRGIRLNGSVDTVPAWLE